MLTCNDIPSLLESCFLFKHFFPGQSKNSLHDVMRITKVRENKSAFSLSKLNDAILSQYMIYKAYNELITSYVLLTQYFNSYHQKHYIKNQFKTLCYLFVLVILWLFSVLIYNVIMFSPILYQVNFLFMY